MISTERLASYLPVRFLSFGIIGVAALVPLQTLITISLAHHFDRLYLFTAWKEVAIAILSFLALWLVFANRTRVKFPNRWLWLAIMAYAVLHLVFLAFENNDFPALVSAATNLRFLAFFVVAFVAGQFNPKLSRQLAITICAVSVAVAIFGLLLVTILPTNSLEWFGYDAPGKNSAGIPPAYHYVADTELVRAQSTLRGPNALGAFLILPIALLLFARQRQNSKTLINGLLALFYMLLFLTYSRTAWIAAAIVGTGWFFHAKLTQNKKQFLLIFAAAVVLIAGFVLTQTNAIKPLILHENSNSVSSTEGHLTALQKGVEDVASNPVGGGLASAGAASALTGEEAKISENYFLQIGQEVGWLGLALLLFIHVSVALMLWKHRAQPYAPAILVAFVGLVIANLLLHTWADEAVAISFWGLTGAVLGNAIIKESEQRTTKAAKSES